MSVCVVPEAKSPDGWPFDLTGDAVSTGGGSGSGDLLPLLASGGGGESIALAHNPEPTSMLLLGGGMMAMAYLRTKTMKSGSSN